MPLSNKGTVLNNSNLTITRADMKGMNGDLMD